MAREKEYTEIVKEEAEKLRDILGPQKKKKSLFDDVDDAIKQVFTIVVAGPIIVVMIMFVSLIVCEMCAFVADPSGF